ncbi:MAG: helix-turn-helix domain-containing protein [Chthoniobacter sp.]
MDTRRPLLIALGKRLRFFREQRQLTQESLAERADLDPTYISGIERGVRNPSVLSLAPIAKALDVSLSEVFSGVDR